MSYGRFAKFSFDIAYTSNVKLKLDKFLNGIGGIRIWFFLPGILIMEQSSSTLYKSFRQIIYGTSHLAEIGKQIDYKLSSCISRTPSIR